MFYTNDQGTYGFTTEDSFIDADWLYADSYPIFDYGYVTLDEIDESLGLIDLDLY